MSTVLFRSLRWQLAGCLLAFSLVTQAQGVKGFSSQTQPSEEIDITRVEAADFYLQLAEDKKVEQVRYQLVLQAKADYEVAKKGQKQDTTAARQRYNAALFSYSKLARVAAPLLIPAPKLQEVPANDPTTTGIAIDDQTKLLQLYDDVNIIMGSRKGLGKWHVGILSDGDFNKTLSEADAPSPKTGSLGVDAIWMKPVYSTYTYSGVGKEDLIGTTLVQRPYVVFNTLAIIFAQTTPLSTGLSATQLVAERRAFGQALLVPGSNAQGGLSFTVNTSWFPWLLRESRIHNVTLDLNLNLTQTRWESRGVTSDVNIFAPMLGGSYRILDENIKVGTTQNQVQVLVFGRYSGRHLFGDIQRYPTILEDALGTRNRTYHGFDVGFTTSINAIRLTVNVPVMEGDIEGFSDGQPVLGLGLAAAIRLN